MNSYIKRLPFAVMMTLLSMLFCLAAVAKDPTDVTVENSEAAAQDSPPGPAGSSSDNVWRFDLAAYVWVPGMHGTVGALGHDVSVHLSGSDVLSDFNGGLASFFEADKGRLLIPIDFFWATRRCADKEVGVWVFCRHRHRRLVKASWKAGLLATVSERALIVLNPMLASLAQDGIRPQRAREK